MIDPEREVEHNLSWPANPRAAIFVGRLGSREVVEVALPLYITAPDGSIGLSAAALGKLAAELTTDSIIWVRSNPAESGPTDDPDEISHEAAEEEPIKFMEDRVSVDLNRRELIVDGLAQSLTKKQFDVLSLLAKNAGRAVGRDEILEICWGTNWHGLSKNIDIHVSSIRKKMGETSKILKTVYGVGFMIDDRPEPEPAA